MDKSQKGESKYKVSNAPSRKKDSPSMAANEISGPESIGQSVTRAEILFVRLIDDIELMSQFARNTGKQLSDELVNNISKLLADTSVTESRGSKK